MNFALKILIALLFTTTTTQAAKAKTALATPEPSSLISNGSFEEFPVRPDTDGIHVGAHHGGILFAEGKYWWYGQCLSPKPAADRGSATERGVAMYSSSDLVKWRNEGIVLSCQNEGELKGPLRFARSKIVFNSHTKKYVLWCHYVRFPGSHGVEEGTADAGVAVCDTVNGKYQWRGIQRPLGPDMVVKDCTLFQDEDGKAYFIFDTYPKDRSVRRRLYMAELSDDYLSCRKVRPLEGLEVREAPAMFKHNGSYFLITSGVTSWKPNPPRVHRSKHVFGPYTDLGNFCRGDNDGTTFNSQPTFVFEIRHKPGTFVYMGDRWNLQNMAGSAHIWLPLQFTSPDNFEMHYLKSWDINSLAAAAKSNPPAGADAKPL